MLPVADSVISQAITGNTQDSFAPLKIYKRTVSSPSPSGAANLMSDGGPRLSRGIHRLWEKDAIYCCTKCVGVFFAFTIRPFEVVAPKLNRKCVCVLTTAVLCLKCCMQIEQAAHRPVGVFLDLTPSCF